MKKSIFFQFCMSLLVLLFVPVVGRSQTVAAEEKEKLCEDHKYNLLSLKLNLIELEKQISQAWPDRQIENARTKMVAIKKINSKIYYGKKLTPEEVKQFHKIASEFNFIEKDLGCEKLGNKDEQDFNYTNRCVELLEEFITKKIDTAVSLKPKRAGLPEEKIKLVKQIQEIQDKIVALRCMWGEGACVMPIISGKYRTDGDPTGILVFSQTGNHVTGKYGKDENSLVNNLSGDFNCNVLTGVFTNAAYKTTGTFKYTFTHDGSLYIGKWKNDKDGRSGAASGTRQK